MAQDKSKQKDKKAIKDLEKKKRKLTTELKKLNKPAKNDKEKAKNELKITGINTELDQVNQKLEGLKAAISVEALHSEEDSAQENDKVDDEASSSDLNKLAATEIPTTDESEEKTENNEILPIKPETIEYLKNNDDKVQQLKKCLENKKNLRQMCAKCNRPYPSKLSKNKSCRSSLTQNPCDSILAKITCPSIGSSKSLRQLPIQKSCSQSRSLCPSQNQLPKNTQSKTCINCGVRYKDDDVSMNAVRSNSSIHQILKPQNRSCYSSKTNLASENYSQYSCRNNFANRNQEFPTRTKCSLGQKYSGRSVNFSLNGGTQNYDSDLDFQDDEIFENLGCNENLSMKSFCKCEPDLDCNDPCNANANDACGEEEDECEKLRRLLRELDTFVPKEPSQLLAARGLLQDRPICRPSEKKPSKIIKKFDPTKPRLHRTKKPVDTDLECPSNPCCISEESRARFEKVLSKLEQREGKRQSDIKAKKEASLKRKLQEQCGEDDECKKTECGEQNSCVEYCKKYQKMKYEIEVQNYLVEKLNRELQMKICSNFPCDAISELKCNLEKEINKLRDMVEFTIFQQCSNRDLKWGSIPISPLTSDKIQNEPKKHCIPKTPSGISDISAFSMLEGIKLCQEKERCEQKALMEMNRQRDIHNLLREIQEMECTMSKLMCQHEELLNNLSSIGMCDGSQESLRTQNFTEMKNKMEKILCEIQTTKNELDDMHKKLHLIQNPT